jgi:hypothetical protein
MMRGLAELEKRNSSIEIRTQFADSQALIYHGPTAMGDAGMRREVRAEHWENRKEKVANG